MQLSIETLALVLTLSSTPRKSGAIRYACAMDMVAGALIVE